jgi:phosphatidylglycerol:prolipoprotein diacylglycerol transferase
MFMLYLLFAGIERVIIEFFRLNPRTAIGLTQAQIISIALIVIGIGGWSFLKKRVPARP